MVRKSGIQLKTGSKWSVQSAIQEAESRLKHKDLVGVLCCGKQGLGYLPQKESRYDQASSQQRRTMVCDEIRRMENEKRLTKAVSMRNQGAWMKWEGVESRDIKWNELWKMEPLRFGFLFRETLLPARLRRGKVEIRPR